MVSSCVINCLLHSVAEWLHLGPWARGLKTLSDDSVEKAEVSDVSNHVSELINLDSVLGTSGKTLVLGGNFMHTGHLKAD